MKRKVVALIMATVMTVGMCACGNAKDLDKNPVEETVEQGSTAKTQEEATTEPALDIAQLDMAEYVTLNEYKNMTVQVNKTEMTDESIEYYINTYMLSSYPITNRAVAEGDEVVIDFVGKKDGVAFDGGSAEDYSIVIGSNTFIDGFEAGLVGVMPGTTVDLNLTFPDTYPAEDLAGQQVVFTVTVDSIQEYTDYKKVTMPQLAQMGLSYKSKQELWDAAAQLQEAELEAAYQSSIKGAIFTKLFEESTILNVPEELVEEELNGYMVYMEYLCQAYYQCDLETFVTSAYAMTLDEYRDNLRLTAEETVKQYLLVEATARDLGIELTEEEFMKIAQEDAVYGGYTSVEDYLEQAGRTAIRATILYEDVMNTLAEMVTVEPLVVE